MKKHSRDNAPQNFMNFLYKIFNILYPQPQGEKKRLALIEVFETGTVHWSHKYSLTSASQYKFALYSIMFPYLLGKEIAFDHLFFQKDVIGLFIALCTIRSCHTLSGTNTGWGRASESH